MGVSELFEVTVSTEEVAAGKPAPDGYRRALELPGVGPAAAVIDSLDQLNDDLLRRLRSALSAQQSTVV